MGNKAMVKEKDGEEFIPNIFNSLMSNGFKYLKSSKRQHVAQLNTKALCELYFDAQTNFGETNRWKLRFWNLKHYEHLSIGIGCYGSHDEITTTLPDTLPTKFNVFVTLDRSGAAKVGSDGVDKLIIYLPDIDKELVTEQKQDDTDDLETRIMIKGSEKATIKSWISKTQMMINANISKETIKETNDENNDEDNDKDTDKGNDNVNDNDNELHDNYMEEEDEPILMKQEDVKKTRVAFKTIEKADHHGIEKWEIYDFLQKEKGYKVDEIDHAFTLYGQEAEKKRKSMSNIDLSDIANLDIAIIGGMSGMDRHQSDYENTKSPLELDLHSRYPFYDDYNLRVLIDGFVRETVSGQNLLNTVNQLAIDTVFIHLFVDTDNDNIFNHNAKIAIEPEMILRSETMEQEFTNRSNRALMTINEEENDNEANHSDEEAP